MCSGGQHVFVFMYLGAIHGRTQDGIASAPVYPPAGTICCCKALVATVMGQTADRLEVEGLEAAWAR